MITPLAVVIEFAATNVQVQLMSLGNGSREYTKVRVYDPERRAYIESTRTSNGAEYETEKRQLKSKYDQFSNNIMDKKTNIRALKKANRNFTTEVENLKMVLTEI